MKDSTFCFGEHSNGFTHLTANLKGFENEFDLGYKFEENHNPNEYIEDKSSKSKGWAEPILLLYISISPKNAPDITKSIKYGLIRSNFHGGLNADDMDKEKLLEYAKNNIQSLLASGDYNKYLDNIIYC